MLFPRKIYVGPTKKFHGHHIWMTYKARSVPFEWLYFWSLVIVKQGQIAYIRLYKFLFFLYAEIENKTVICYSSIQM